MENNLFSLGFQERPAELASGDPTIHYALAQAKALDGRGDLLVSVFHEPRPHSATSQSGIEAASAGAWARPGTRLWKPPLIPTT